MPRSAKPQEHLADAGADRNANPGAARPRALRHHSRFQTIPGTDMRQPLTFAALLLALTLPALPAAAQDAPLPTVAEHAGFVQTGRYADVRSEGRRVGTECGGTGGSRWSAHK